MDISFFIKILFAILINGFGLIVFWSFRFFKMHKKDETYLETIRRFGLKARFEDIGNKKVIRKPSTVLRHKNYWLPIAFFTVTCTIISSLFLFPSLLFGELFEKVIQDGLAIQSTEKFSHNPFFLGGYFGTLELNHEPSISNIQRRSIATLSWAFIGAFLWSASNMVRRLSKADITPVLYYKSSFRLLFACGVALVFSFIIDRIPLGGMAYSSAIIPAVAFIAGTLPERFFNYMTSLLKNVFSGRDVNSKTLHLRHIEGLSISHRERLWEEGIDNAQNLSQASLTDLLLKTPFEARQILDWMGQAKLLTHMKEDIHRAHAVGIRSMYDFISLRETYHRKRLDNMNAIEELGRSAGFSTPKLAVVSELANEDLGIRSLKAFLDKLNGKGEVAALYQNVDVQHPETPKDEETSSPTVDVPPAEETPSPNIPTDIPKSYD